MTPSETMQYRNPYESRERYMDMEYPCDLCGGARHVSAIDLYEDPLWLCPRCNEYVGCHPGRLSGMVKTFIIGNAL
ncbi:MAG TPA: hypothetical protein PKM41_13170 [Deltaproteobacteria bacterium]|jgi:hypothetical protein|nr:hypothetical protein [Deltaproteobacteria bacterium]HOI07976.1 hypothetical protein [Deltaproteobacteria bacterium]